MDLNTLKKEYVSVREEAERFREMLVAEVTSLLRVASLIPATSAIESRIKEWSSIEEKIRSRDLELESVKDVADLVGLRIVLLYLRDLEQVRRLIEGNFADIRREDTARRLDVTQFGYQSIHYDVRMKDEWLARPTARGFKGFRAEIQVRTLAQHIWAAASHQLQYKEDQDVPRPIRRSIYRVSALLETVDLEFERVLQERETYLAQAGAEEADEPLNVDMLKAILDETLPEKNKNPKGEPYALLIESLRKNGIDGPQKLRGLLDETLEEVLEEDRRMLERLKERPVVAAGYQEEIERGAYFFQSEIVLRMLKQKLGDGVKD